MEHAAHEVDILNEAGKVIGTKRRRDIDKAHDIFNTVYVFLITPTGEVVLTNIPEREDLPNLFAGKLGTPVATIRRSHETAAHAAQRGVARELFIDEADVHFIDESMRELSGRKSLASVFSMVGEPPRTYSKTDIGGLVTITPKELDRQMQESPENFAPSLQELWHSYRSELPV